MANEAYDDKGKTDQQTADGHEYDLVAPGPRSQPAGNASSTGGRSSYSSGSSSPPSYSMGGGSPTRSGLRQAEEGAGDTGPNDPNTSKAGNNSDTGGSISPTEPSSGADSPSALQDRENTPDDQIGHQGLTPNSSHTGGQDTDVSSTPDDQVGQGFTPGNSNHTGGKNTRLSFTRRKKALAGSGIIITVVLGILGAASGPLEFVHIAQLLDRFHFSSQQDGGDGRMMKIARYIRDTSKPQNTRLGLVGNAVADRLETKINDATGLHSDYNPSSGRFLGYTVDRTRADFKGKTPDEIKNQLASEYGISRGSITESPEGVLSFNPDTGGRISVTGYFKQTAFARTLLAKAGFSKVSVYAGARVLRTRAGWSFHPIKQLDANIQAAAIEAGAKGIKKLKDQFTKDQTDYVEGGTPVPADGVPAPEEETAANGKPLPPAQQSIERANEAKDIKADSSRTNIKAKIATGGGASLIALACILRNVDAHVAQERQAKVVLPMMRFAGQMISVGSQVQSGQDISALQVGFFKQFVDGTDSNGNVTSNVFQARSIQAELGEPQTGPDIPTQGQVFTKNTPFSFLDSIPGISQVCGVLGGFLGQVFSIVTGPINFIVSGEILKYATGFLSDWLSGSPINIANSGGAADGNYMNYGARAAANDQYASAGGTQMDSGDEANLKKTSVALDNADFQSKSFAYRIFNPDDSQTLASQLMDNYETGNAPQDIARMANGFSSIFAGVAKIPSTLFSSIVHATPQPYDYHGLKAVGFTAADLANPLYDNSFDNGCYVVGNCKLSDGTQVASSQSILGDPSQPNQAYLDNISACFGDKVSFDGTMWNINFGSEGTVDPYSDSYPASACDSHDTNWMRIRFWLLDTQTIEGYDCSQGGSSTSDQSCQDIGAASSGNSTNSGSPITAASGNSQQLAQQILSNKNIDLSYNASVSQDIQDAAAGKPGTAGVLTSAAILQLIATVGQTHKVLITAIQSNGQGHCNDTPKSGCPGDPHYNGDAVDFGSLDGVTITGRNPPAITIMQLAFPLLPSGSGFGQNTCGAQYTDSSQLPNNDITFYDTCNHLHVQVHAGTP